jgi:hypothetical protein
MDKFINLAFSSYTLVIIWFSVIGATILIEHFIQNILIKFWNHIIASLIYNFIIAFAFLAYFKKLMIIKEGWEVYIVVSLALFFWGYYDTYKQCKLLMSVPANLYSAVNKKFLQFNKKPKFFDNSIILNLIFFISPVAFYLFLEILHNLLK